MLTLQFIPFNEIEHLSSERRINKLLSSVKKNNVVVMQGKLKPQEEAELIQRTMEEVSKDFKGIELCTISQDRRRKRKREENLKEKLVKWLVGDREGMTIIGPANVVKEIKKNPDKIELLTHNLKRTRRKKKE